MLDDQKRAFLIHESLVRFLNREHGHESPHVIVVALSYEIGRVLGGIAESLTDDDIDTMIAGVADVLRTHIAAFRGGLRR